MPTYEHVGSVFTEEADGPQGSGVILEWRADVYKCSVCGCAVFDTSLHTMSHIKASL